MVIHYQVLFILLNPYQHFVCQILYFLLEQGEDKISCFLCILFFTDFKVVVMNLNDDSNKMKYFNGHQPLTLALNIYEEKRWLVRTDL
jgi:hypothetical protein